MNSTPGKIRNIFIWTLLGALVGWQLNTAFLHDSSADSGESITTNSEQVDMDLFWYVWSLIEDDYIDIEEVDSNEEVYGAITGLVEALDDPFSYFMTPDETQQFASSLNGDLEGIGAELTERDGKLIVVSPLKDSPAANAGLLPGDHIIFVDEESTAEMTLWDAIMMIRGEEGTDVTLTVLRESTPDPVAITITRASIHIPSVEVSYDEVNGQTVATLAMYQFGDDTYKEFKEALRDMELNSADAMILDMRMNGGGFLDVSVEIVGEFFEDEVKSVIVKRRNNQNDMLYTSGGGSIPDMPVVVLIDEGSASATEIVAGALQDFDRALLMGEQSFGKGTVQELTQLADGSSLRLSVAKWYTPNDRSINDVGITPDVIIEMEPTEIDGENDIQHDAALEYLGSL